MQLKQLNLPTVLYKKPLHNKQHVLSCYIIAYEQRNRSLYHAFLDYSSSVKLSIFFKRNVFRKRELTFIIITAVPHSKAFNKVLTKRHNQLTFLKPMSLAYCLKHRLHMFSPYFLIRPWWLLHTRLEKNNFSYDYYSGEIY